MGILRSSKHVSFIIKKYYFRGGPADCLAQKEALHVSPGVRFQVTRGLRHSQSSLYLSRKYKQLKGIEWEWQSHTSMRLRMYATVAAVNRSYRPQQCMGPGLRHLHLWPPKTEGHVQNRTGQTYTATWMRRQPKFSHVYTRTSTKAAQCRIIHTRKRTH